jgi:hypothetical protein
VPFITGKRDAVHRVTLLRGSKHLEGTFTSEEVANRKREISL